MFGISRQRSLKQIKQRERHFIYYLNKCFDFENSEYSKLIILSIKKTKQITWDMKDLAIYLKITFDANTLHKDFYILRKVQDNIVKSNEDVDLRWVKFFSIVEN